MQIPGAVDWVSLEAGHAVPVRLSSESAVFVRRGTSGIKLPYWFLGMPVDVFQGKGNQTGEVWTSLEPVFVIAVRPEVRDENTVILEPVSGLEVNPGWLQRRFKHSDKRLEFLATVGLDDLAFGDLEEREDHRLRLATFRMALEAMRTAYKAWWREFPSLDGLQTEPPLEEIAEGGLYNRALLVSQPKLKYARRLFDELTRLADPAKVSDEDLDRTALAALFPHNPPRPTEEQSAPETPRGNLTEYKLLNEEQRQAVDAAMRHRLTVLTGPPGTGKSVTVAHVMANMALERRSVLFASRNHQAIEAVEPLLNALVEPETLVLRPTRPWGQEARTAGWQKALIQLLTRPARPEASESLIAARSILTEQLQVRSGLEGDLGRLLDLTDELARLEPVVRQTEGALDAETRAMVTACASLPGVEIVKALIADMEVADISRRPLLLRLLLRPWRWLLRLVRLDPERPLVMRHVAILASVRDAIPDYLCESGDVKHSLAEAVAALRNLLPLLLACEARRNLEACRANIEAMGDRERLTEKLHETTLGVHEQTIATLRLLAEVSGAEIDPETRQRFAELRAGLENHKGSATQRHFEKAFAKSLPDLLKHYPLWAVSNLSASKAMPLAPGVADLLIVDEASQCDIPSVVPLLFRAKRALIVGDPMQLGHITSMSRPAELRLRESHGLVGPLALERFSVGANSLYDLVANAASRDALIQLRAHYRCHPQIANYFNRAFYNGNLRVMTDVRKLRHLPGASDSVRGCEWMDVRGEIVSASSGCHSPAQVSAVLEELDRLDNAGFSGTVGVVTPFRVQADRIRDAVHQRFPSESIDRWKFLAHTVDGFQGDERDVILFSLVGGPGMPQGSHGFLGSTPNRFNVAISRARSFLRIIGDRDWARSCGIPHIGELLKACERPDTTFIPRMDLMGPVWEPRLAAALKEAGLSFGQQYAAAGYYLDFALLSETFRLDVEVDGEAYHRGGDGHRLLDDLYRDHNLQAAGWRVLRFWVYQLREDLDGCIATIRTVWNGGRGDQQESNSQLGGAG